MQTVRGKLCHKKFTRARKFTRAAVFLAALSAQSQTNTGSNMSEGMHGCVVALILMLVSVAKSKATLLVRPPTVLTDCDMVIPEEGVYACVKSVDERGINQFHVSF